VKKSQKVKKDEETHFFAFEVMAFIKVIITESSVEKKSEENLAYNDIL